MADRDRRDRRRRPAPQGSPTRESRISSSASFGRESMTCRTSHALRLGVRLALRRGAGEGVQRPATRVDAQQRRIGRRAECWSAVRWRAAAPGRCRRASACRRDRTCPSPHPRQAASRARRGPSRSSAGTRRSSLPRRRRACASGSAARAGCSADGCRSDRQRDRAHARAPGRRRRQQRRLRMTLVEVFDDRQRLRDHRVVVDPAWAPAPAG